MAGELITFYGGPVARFRALASVPRRQRSHLRVLVPYRWLLVGDAHSARLGEPGTGGGALMNDPRGAPGAHANAEFVAIDSADNEARIMAGALDPIDPFGRIVAVRAIEGISPGAELLVEYGGAYWAHDDMDDEEDDMPDVEFDLVTAPPPPPPISTEAPPKRRRMAPTPITDPGPVIMAYSRRRCDVCLLRAVTHVWPALGLYCCSKCLEE